MAPILPPKPEAATPRLMPSVDFKAFLALWETPVTLEASEETHRAASLVEEAAARDPTEGGIRIKTAITSTKEALKYNNNQTYLDNW